jgi:DNA repair photolyase
MPHLDELDRLGYRYYFLFTLLDYPERFEPELRPLEERIETFRRLAERIGPGRVVWRYDPILVTGVTDLDFHRRSFERLADQLEGATRRVIISFYDAYRSTERRLSALGQAGIRHYSREELFETASPKASESKEAHSSRGGGEVPKEHTGDFLRQLARAARERSIRPTSCAEPLAFDPYGIEAAPCIDPDLIERELGLRVTRAKDPGQRRECLCVKSRDIGVYGTCPAGCIYCYAQR